jgi:hypothetical protein
MAQIPKTVNPGDLILADFFNSVVTVLNDHETRISNLEGIAPGSKVVINAVLPSATFHPGDQITVVGRNFGVPALNSVTIANAVITTFTVDSNDTSLTFTVPLMTGITGQLNTMLTVSNPSGSAQTPVVLLPGQPTLPQGLIQVVETQASQATNVLAGQDLFLTFAVTGSTSQLETYNVLATVDAGWSAVLVDSSHVPIVPQQISISQGTPPQGVNFPFLVKVSVPSGLSNGVIGNVNVSVTSQLNPNLLNASTNQPYPITVGFPPPGPQDAVFIQLTSVFSPGAKIPLAPPKTGNAIFAPANGQTVVVTFDITLKTTDSYKVSVPAFANPATDWGVTIVSGGAFTTITPGQKQTLKLNLTAGSNAKDTTMTIGVVSTTNASISGQLGQAVQIHNP